MIDAGKSVPEPLFFVKRTSGWSIARYGRMRSSVRETMACGLNWNGLLGKCQGSLGEMSVSDVWFFRERSQLP